MKKLLFFLILSFIVCAHSFSQEKYRTYDKSSIKTYQRGNEEIPLRPGMQLRKIGGINAVVPEGTEIYERKGLLFIESPEEYAARRFKETEERFQKLESTVKAFGEKIENLTKELQQKPESEPQPEPEPTPSIPIENPL